MNILLQTAFRRRAAILLRWGVLAIFAVVTLYPLVWMVSASLKADAQVFEIPVRWIPDPILFENYPTAMREASFLRPMLNSVFVTGCHVLINLVVASLAGYGLAKFQFRGRWLIIIAILTMTLLPLQVIMIPLFLIVNGIGWYDSFQGLIFPTAASAFAVFLMRQFILAIPSDYLDAARMDGAGELAVFRHAVLPQLWPALVAIGVLVTSASWDEFLWPLIIVGGPEMQTAPLALSRLDSQFYTPFNLLLAAAVTMLAPPLLLFIFAQRQIIETASHTGVK